MVGIVEVVVDFAELPSASAETWVRTWPGETLAVDLVRPLAHLEVAASCSAENKSIFKWTGPELCTIIHSKQLTIRFNKFTNCFYSTIDLNADRRLI